MTAAKDHEQILRGHIRRLLIMNGGMTNIEIAKHLRLAGIRISDDYVGRLRKKIIREKLKSELHWTLRVFLQNFIDQMDEADRRLWQIAAGKSEPARTRIAALGQIRENRKAVLDKLFEAGVFKRQLGELKTLTLMELVQDVTQAPRKA